MRGWGVGGNYERDPQRPEISVFGFPSPFISPPPPSPLVHRYHGDLHVHNEMLRSTSFYATRLLGFDFVPRRGSTGLVTAEIRSRVGFSGSHCPGCWFMIIFIIICLFLENQSPLIPRWPFFPSFFFFF